MKKRIKILLLVLLIGMIVHPCAYAYLDPGTGSMVLQIILASIVGISCTFNVWKNKLLSLFIKKGNEDFDCKRK